MKFRILLSLIILIGAGCSGKKVLDSSNKVTSAGVISIWADWVKNKGDKYDISFNLQNESEKPIIVFLSDVSCYKGDMTGTLKHTFFNTGERTIDLRPNEQKRANMVCRHGAKSKGDYKIEIRKVFSNPTGNGMTPGKAIASNVVWTQPSK